MMGGDQHHQGGGGGGGGGGGALRDYRKGNWTLQETMILIEAKKMDDERRMKKLSGETMTSNKPTELRWKWVEDYCWRKSCFRSQNQCNDKWDNLMRDYKRVRDYHRLNNNNEEEGCYWKIEKSERKGKNLPSNMLHQIYEALVEVVERKGIGIGSSSSQPPPAQETVERVTGYHHHHVNVVDLIPSAAINVNVEARPINQIAAPIFLPTATTTAPLHPLPPTTTTSDTESPQKRRREEASSSTSSTVEAITKGALMITEAIERGEKRHKELLSLHERRLHSQESTVHALVHAINNLANSINQNTPK